jgi:hypothetical protein
MGHADGVSGSASTMAACDGSGGGYRLQEALAGQSGSRLSGSPAAAQVPPPGRSSLSASEYGGGASVAVPLRPGGNAKGRGRTRSCRTVTCERARLASLGGLLPEREGRREEARC